MGATFSIDKVIGNSGDLLNHLLGFDIDTRSPPHREDRPEQAPHMETGVDPVTQHHVEEMIDRLAAEFGDRFERERIAELMEDSVTQLASSAHVPDFLPVLAYRFTRERLGSIGRAPGTSPDVVFRQPQRWWPRPDGSRADDVAIRRRSRPMRPAPRATASWTRRSRRSSTSSGDRSEFFVRPVSSDILAAADVIVTMGHSVGRVELPEGVKHEDWRVGDPVGARIEETRRVRDDIERRVHELLVELRVLLPREAPDEPDEATETDDG